MSGRTPVRAYKGEEDLMEKPKVRLIVSMVEGNMNQILTDNPDVDLELIVVESSKSLMDEELIQIEDEDGDVVYAISAVLKPDRASRFVEEAFKAVNEGSETDPRYAPGR